MIERILFRRLLSGRELGRLLLVLLMAEPCAPTRAQLVPDTTLGAQASTVTTRGSIDTVQGGLRSGSMLFHSFRELNLASGRSLYFQAPNVSHILTRVTGSYPSQINGRLGVLGNANLFLLNPNGIIFGAGASLDIRGSFIATTAAAVKLSDGSEFSAISPSQPNLLTISVPVGLQPATNQPVGTIINQAQLLTGQDLTLVADRLILQGRLEASRDLTLRATDLQVGNALTLPALLQAGRAIQIQSDRLNVTAGSQIRTTTGGTGQVGHITLGTVATPIDQIVISGPGSGISTSTGLGSRDNGGDIALYARNLSLTNGARINASTTGQGNAGTITLRATDSINLENSSVISGVALGGNGNGGLIDLTARSLTLRNRGRIQALTLGGGQAGDIQVQADTVVITDLLSGIISGSSDPSRRGLVGIGDGGNIRLRSETLQIVNEGIVSVSTFSDGRSGSIEVTAREIDLTNQGRLSATTQSQGTAGSITVVARDRLTVSGARSGLFASATAESSGNGGNISVTTPYLQVQDRGRITADSRGTGKGGDIQLVAHQAELDNQATVFAETSSSQGGNIQIQANGLLRLHRQSLISASAGTARAGGNGGNITIDAEFVVGVLGENSDIRANAFTGDGGQVNITAQGIFGLRFQPRTTALSDITASSQFGLNGTVTLNTLNIDPNRGAVQLSDNFADSSNQIAQVCSAEQRHNRFVVTGRGGVSPEPTEALNQTPAWTDATAVSGNRDGESRSSPVVEAKTQAAIAESTAWIKHADGSISLVAAAPLPLPILAPSCQAHPLPGE